MDITDGLCKQSILTRALAHVQHGRKCSLHQIPFNICSFRAAVFIHCIFPDRRNERIKDPNQNAQLLIQYYFFFFFFDFVVALVFMKQYYGSREEFMYMYILYIHVADEYANIYKHQNRKKRTIRSTLRSYK